MSRSGCRETGAVSIDDFPLRRTVEHIFGYLVEIKGLQQWYGKFDAIEFDPNLLEGEETPVRGHSITITLNGPKECQRSSSVLCFQLAYPMLAVSY